MLIRLQARTVQRKLLALGIDPDLPPDALNVPFAQTHVWDMTTAERVTFSQALEVDDRKVIAKHMTTSRQRSVATIGKISATVRRMLDGAGTPAVIMVPRAALTAKPVPVSVRLPVVARAAWRSRPQPQPLGR